MVSTQETLHHNVISREREISEWLCVGFRLQWFGEMLQAWKASNALAPLLEKAVCAKELQLEWAANI